MCTKPVNAKTMETATDAASFTRNNGGRREDNGGKEEMVMDIR